MKIPPISTLLPLFTLLLFACNKPPPTQITIKNVQVRQNISPQTITVAYMAIHNTGPLTALASATTPAAEITELHVITHDGNIMHMKKIDRLPIPANGSATLQPGGNHLMLIGLKHDLVPGDSLSLTLSFSNGQQQTVQALITPINQPKP